VRSVAATAAWRLLPLVVGAAVGRGAVVGAADVGDGVGAGTAVTTGGAVTILLTTKIWYEPLGSAACRSATCAAIAVVREGAVKDAMLLAASAAAVPVAGNPFTTTSTATLLLGASPALCILRDTSLRPVISTLLGGTSRVAAMALPSAVRVPAEMLAAVVPAGSVRVVVAVTFCVAATVSTGAAVGVLVVGAVGVPATGVGAVACVQQIEREQDTSELTALMRKQHA
jgi:hypothetical protein